MLIAKMEQKAIARFPTLLYYVCSRAYFRNSHLEHYTTTNHVYLSKRFLRPVYSPFVYRCFTAEKH